MMHILCETLIASLVGVFIAMTVSAHAQTQSTPNGAPPDNTVSAEEGQRLFNEYCSHCHGANAVQGEKSQDLRRLKIRYGDARADIYWTAVMIGRPDKGMPSWSGALDAKVLQHIQAFLETVQK